MKNTILLFAILSLVGCSEERKSTKINSKLMAINPLSYEIYLEVIDGCEYLVMDGSYAGGIIHKENCKNH